MVRYTPAARVWLVQFSAPWHSFAGRAFGIAFLSLITLGLYKPYGITRTRRALYGHIYIGKDPLEYSGTAQSLSRVTFYPSLAFLFLLLGPGVLQFLVSWQVAVAIGALQLLLLVYYSCYLDYASRQYEWNNISWRGLSFSAVGSAFDYANKRFGYTLLCYLTAGLAAPWRRVFALRSLYGQLYYGRLPVSCTLEVAPLLLRYICGLVFAWVGWALVGYYGWQHAVVPVQAILSGGGADPAMASAVDPALFSGGMPGAPDPTSMAEVGTFISALTLAFILLPLGLLWQKICLAPYEAAVQRNLCDSISVGGSGLRFDGGVIGFGLLNCISFLLNFVFANLTRPFTTYARLRYLARHIVVTAPEALESAVKPVIPKT